ncbi:hypothetical protein [Candidatus Nitrosotenuis chungbukensis]|uniref:hypothetical protein n=1 Tax=Candidatus Nitrosotenuis chungbukensis TaxID=1353246 RepID=UPI0005B2CBB6|nr:hypothetical protein [Candidatus Nitrosotenuis chungbukensis]
MSDLKVEILLPLYYNQDQSGKRKEVEGSKFTETFDDLMDRFGGCTVDDTPLLGGWVDPKTKDRINDTNTTYWVVCKKTKKNVEFLHKLKKVLKKRFEQEDIMMYFVTITRI